MKDIQQINKGIIQDLNQEFQPPGSYRFMLNGVLETLSGEKGGIANERGNTAILATPTGITSPNVVGDCLLPNQDKVIFITGNDGSQEVQIIGLHKENNTFVELIRTKCLEFTKCTQVDCIFKVHNGCDIIIYFTDHENRYKCINISAVEAQTGRYEKPSHVDWNAGSDPNVPTVDPGVGVGIYGWDCDSFFLSPTSTQPDIHFHKQSNNGNLRTGAYTFFVRLLDSDLNPTDWLVWSNPIFVKKGDFNFNSTPENTDGYYIDPNVENFVSRSLSLAVNNLDTAFQYYEIGILERSLNTALPSFAYRTGQRKIPTTGNDIFIFSDVGDSRYITYDLASLVTKTRKIDVVQAHAQINNRLIVGNVKGSTRDWASFQKVASEITTEYFTYCNVSIDTGTCDNKYHFVGTGHHAYENEVAANPYWAVNVPTGVNYSSPEFLSYGMSLMRDEIYALGIIYIFKDGSESPVFHIPGRPKFSDVVLDWTIDGDITSAGYAIDGFDYSVYAHTHIKTLTDAALDAASGAILTAAIGLFDNQTLDVAPGTGVPNNHFRTWESDRLTNLPQDNTLANVQTDEYKYLYGFKDFVTCCNYVPFNSNSCASNDLQRWQYYNTAIRRKDVSTGLSWDRIDDKPTVQGDNPIYEFNGGFRGIPGYADTGVEYPDTLDCDGVRIFPEGYVRHHKMPDHRIEQIFDHHQPLGFSTITNTGQTNPTLWTSNILTWGDVATGENWQYRDSEASLKLYPLGLYFHNVEPPTDYRDDVVGYYFVRSDRSNNKTVVDKGFFNVCDTSVSQKPWPSAAGQTGGIEAIDDFQSLVNNQMYPNEFFLSPGHKTGTTSGYAGSLVGDGYKTPTHTWWNILEIYTPKSKFNDELVLSADYVKVESTVFGDLYFDSNRQYYSDVINPDDGFVNRKGGGGINVGASVFLNRHKYPRVQNPIGRYYWTFIYNIPISGMIYMDYNQTRITSSLGTGTTEVRNGSYQQSTLIAKYHQSCTSVEPTGPDDANAVLNVPGPAANWWLSTSSIFINRSVCSMSFPYYYERLKFDIIDDGPKSYYIQTSLERPMSAILYESATGFGYGVLQVWSRDTPSGAGGSNNISKPHKWSVPHSPYMYYGSLKSAITPYEDFDAIKYIKLHSYLLPFDKDVHVTPQKFPVTGGDTFIQRFQFEKGIYTIDDGNIVAGGNNDQIFFNTTMTVGYVESELNSQFRHLLEGDLFRTFPYDSRRSYYNFLNDAHGVAGATSRSEMDAYMTPQEILYRYKLDYSVINSDIPSFQLPSTFDFCSSCSESFPNTIYYSEISLDSQVQDFYKLFLTNSEKAIPSYTGSIQDLFVKNSDLYVHTENNLWKLSVAPQTMKTSTDTVEVGQGEFLDRDPVKLFNNEDGFARGGTIDKFSSIYGSNGEYIWLDRLSGSVYSLIDQPKLISDVGLSRWFSNHSELNLDSQFKALTSLPYPYKGTSCDINVGYKGILDPNHDRYILTKKDYKLLPAVTGAMIELTTNTAGSLFSPATVVDQYYYDNDGFYVGIAIGTDVLLKDTLVEAIDYNDELLAENKSWTISYSLGDKAWASWHSYIPNWTYNDSTTFYSFVANSTGSINLSIWEHGYGAFTAFYGNKLDYIIDYIYKKSPYQDKTFDTVEYTSNVWLEDTSTYGWIDVPFVTFDRFFVYNNNQLSNLKSLTVGNLTPYANLPYVVTDATAHKTKNIWKVSRLRDMAIGRFNLNESLFSMDWSESTYQTEFDNGFGYIDRVINPSAIDLNKSVYTIERLTDKYLGVRLFFNPAQDYKITFNLLSGEKRIKI